MNLFFFMIANRIEVKYLYTFLKLYVDIENNFIKVISKIETKIKTEQNFQTARLRH